MILMVAACVQLVKSVQLVHTYCKRANIGTVIVGVLAQSWHIWGTHGHICPHQHTMFFSKCVCVYVCLHFKKLGFPSLFFFYCPPPSLPPPSLSQS